MPWQSERYCQVVPRITDVAFGGWAALNGPLPLHKAILLPMISLQDQCRIGHALVSYVVVSGGKIISSFGNGTSARLGLGGA